MIDWITLICVLGILIYIIWMDAVLHNMIQGLYDDKSN